MELELLLRRRAVLLSERRLPVLLVCEVTEARLCIILLVWTFSTGVGVGVRLRRAAAAAAEDRLLDEGWDLRKAWLAADWADCEGTVERG
jgi:hypothetical protein